VTRCSLSLIFATTIKNKSSTHDNNVVSPKITNLATLGESSVGRQWLVSGSSVARQWLVSGSSVARQWLCGSDKMHFIFVTYFKFVHSCVLAQMVGTGK